jgi:hypothetical protein
MKSNNYEFINGYKILMFQAGINGRIEQKRRESPMKIRIYFLPKISCFTVYFVFADGWILLHSIITPFFRIALWRQDSMYEIIAGFLILLVVYFIIIATSQPRVKGVYMPPKRHKRK